MASGKKSLQLKPFKINISTQPISSPLLVRVRTHDAMEGDLEAERSRASGVTRETLIRLLEKLRARRAALAQFTALASPTAPPNG